MAKIQPKQITLVNAEGKQIEYTIVRAKPLQGTKLVLDFGKSILPAITPLLKEGMKAFNSANDSDLTEEQKAEISKKSFNELLKEYAKDELNPLALEEAIEKLVNNLESDNVLDLVLRLLSLAIPKFGGASLGSEDGFNNHFDGQMELIFPLLREVVKHNGFLDLLGKLFPVMSPSNSKQD